MRPITMRALFAASWTVILASSAAAAPQLTGRWEIQSLGSDRTVTITHRGRRLRAYRLLQPELNGKPVKLEHVYRGRIVGKSAIKGTLLVRQQGSARFSPLRAFRGKISSSFSLVLDQLPLKRIRDTEKPDRKKAGSGARLRVLIDGVELQSVALPELARAVDALIARGDRAAKRSRHRRALALYLRASKAAGEMPAKLVHRVGRCYLRLADRERALRYLERARMLDPNGRAVARDLRAARKLE